MLAMVGGVDRWFRSRFGLRRTAGIIIAFFHLGAGLAVALDPAGAPTFQVFPWQLRVVGWVSSGILAAILFIAEDTEPFAWAALMLMPVQRVVGYALTAWVYLVPGGSPGDPEAPGLFMVWAALTALFGWVAAWREGEPARLWRTRKARLDRERA